MRFISLFALIILCALPALAPAQDEIQTPFNPLVIERGNKDAGSALGLNPAHTEKLAVDKKQLLSDLYKTCVNSPSILLEDSYLEVACSCIVAEASGIMRPKEIAQLKEDSEEGDYQRERFAGLIYVPCMQHPIRDMMRDNCLSNSALVEGLKKPVKVCTCVADRAKDYVAKHNKYITLSATKNPEQQGSVDSIIQQFTTSRGFERGLIVSNKHCFKVHELGW